MPGWKEAVWFSFVMDLALKSAVIWGIAWVATKLLSGRSAALRHTIWMAAAAATLAIPFLAAGLPVLRVPMAVPELTFRSTAAGAPAVSARVPVPHAVGLPAAAVSRHPDWRLALMLLWAVGAAIGLAQMLVAGAAMARVRRGARPYPQPEAAAGLAEVLGLDPPVEVLESPAGSMPMTFGVLRPAVFLPADSVLWPDERRRLVLLHELAHVKRGDAATHLLARTALCLHWWSPLAWLAWREFIRERERATDDLVLAAGARASEYAGHLLEVARSLTPAPARSMAWAAVAMARPSQLEGRLVAILNSNVNRKALGPVPAVAVTLLAVLAVAPFAAMRAQEQPGGGVPVFRAASIPADVDATIRAALAQNNYQMIEQAASGFERLKDYATAQKLLEAGLAIREQTSGTASVEYGMGLVKLGDLARQQKQAGEASSFYTRALTALNGKPESAQPLFGLGLIRYAQKNYADAMGYFEQMGAADATPPGRSALWIALSQQQAGNPSQAESLFRRATVEAGSTPLGAAAMYLFSQFLETQNRHDEAATQLNQRDALLKSLAVQVPRSAGTYRVGGGVTAPKLTSKQEPEYSEEARAAKYQGTTILYVEIGPDGLAHNIQVVRGIGMGLDEKAVEAVGNWRFQPGTRDGAAVPVAATIEVNFRLL